MLSVAYNIERRETTELRQTLWSLMEEVQKSATMKSYIASIGGNAEYRIREADSSVENTEMLGKSTYTSPEEDAQTFPERVVRIAALARTKATHKHTHEAKSQPDDNDHQERDQDQCQVVDHGHVGQWRIRDDREMRNARLLSNGLA